INIRDRKGRTALSLAAGDSKAFVASHVVQLLLDTFPNIDINLPDNASRSPLTRAAIGADIRTVEVFLSRYSESALQHLNMPDSEGRTIVSHAAAAKSVCSVYVLRLLLAKLPQIALDTPDNNGRTPLRWALERNHEV
ncbi:ankyrin repeat-containing domain protein, partial [Neurospora tetraspora]